MVECILSLGSNVGNREENLRKAVAEISSDGMIEVVRVSSIYETSPVENPAQPDFLNIALLVRTHYSPEGLLGACKRIESKMGREKTFRYGPRLIDIDIISYGDLSYKTDELEVPHPKAKSRRFVLVPLIEICPGFVFPDGERARTALSRLSDDDKVILQKAW